MKDFKKYYIINGTPEDVYLALTKPLSIELWSGSPAQMDTEVGSEFSLFDGNIMGKNISFEYAKKIVQHWYFDGQEEASIVTFKLHEHKRGTSVEVLQSHIPDEIYEEFEMGWNEEYMGGLVDFFEE